MANIYSTTDPLIDPSKLHLSFVSLPPTATTESVVSTDPTLHTHTHHDTTHADSLTQEETHHPQHLHTHHDTTSSEISGTTSLKPRPKGSRDQRNLPTQITNLERNWTQDDPNSPKISRQNKDIVLLDPRDDPSPESFQPDRPQDGQTETQPIRTNQRDNHHENTTIPSFWI